MRVLVLGHADVARVLPIPACIEVMAGALAALARGEALLPARQVLAQPDGRGVLGLMPSFLDGLGAKVVSVFPGNRGTPYESHQGAVLVFEPEHGRLQAIVDAGAVTAVRTAAVSALATRLLARPDAGDLAILGSGTQAEVHLQAMRAVRPIRRVRVWSRTPEHAARFAARHGVEAVPSAREAVAGADIVCTCTAATAPVLQGEWLAPGAHVNAVGASVPPFRELDPTAVHLSRVFVDQRAAALREALDLEGCEAQVAGELGDLLLGRVAGRPADDAITLFKSVGLAVEDVAAARHAYARAAAEGVGTWLELAGPRTA